MLETAVTQDIHVEVESTFLSEQSDAQMSQFLFSYRIKILNKSSHPVQLINRHWVIMDGFGRVEEVKGPGVIGLQPKIDPGGSFEYESFCPLSTPTGTMRGSYEMVCLEMTTNLSGGEHFNVEIPQFFLVEPGSFH